MRKVRDLAALAVSLVLFGACEKGIVCPDGGLTAVVNGQSVEVYFSDAGKDDVPAVQMHVGVVTSSADFDSGLVLERVYGKKKVLVDYPMVAGKRKHCHNVATEKIYSYKNPAGETMDVILRLYNDGIAVRYVLPEGTELVEDRTAYLIHDGTERWISPLKTDYESFFPHATDGSPTTERMWPRPEPGRWAYPALYQPSDGKFVLISEADLRRGNSASSLDNSIDSQVYTVHLTGPSTLGDGMSPWRMAIVGSLADIVESTLVTDLSQPAEYDADWIEPGVSSWVYWAYNHGSKDFNRNVEFIDLAADMGWPYCLVDWEWPQMENGNIEEVLDYARDKGVRINLWYNSGTSWIGEGAPQPQDRMVDAATREKEMQWLEDHGVSGIKVDFFLPDDAKMVDYYLDILEDASRHHLMVDFHGCTVPRGWQRTWPNLLSMESVYGAEWYNNGPAMTTRAAAHNATLPFTRNVIGPMDYTPGTFSDSQFPHITTYAHELALPILFESGLQHMPDRPEAYHSLPDDVRSLLSSLPSVWDDTVMLAGYPGSYAVLARKNAGKWFIAGINGKDSPCTVDFSVEGIGLSGETVKVIMDGSGDREFLIEERIPGGSFSIPCRARGGFVIVQE